MTLYVEGTEYAGGYVDVTYYRPATDEDVTDEMVKRATEAVVQAHSDEMRAFLAGEIEANVWRPEVYAKAALTAALGQEQKP